MLDILPHRADYYPVLGQIMREMDVAGTISRIVDAGDSQAKIDVGTFVCLMIHNLLGDVNIRLYNMDSFFEDKALPLLVPWKPDVDLDKINDDRAARVLDAVWRSDPQKIFSAIANRVIYIHELDTSIIHGDTTSISFHGMFDDLDLNPFIPVITHGHNKDHRPDLKQLVFGVGTTADGVPVAAEVADGNDGQQTKTLRWGGASGYNSQEPSLYDIIHFKWVDQLFENLHSEIECWSSCTTGEHWGPMVYLGHGSAMWFGNCGSAYGIQDDLHNNWIFHDVMVEGKGFGESAGKYYWIFDRDFTTLDPTTLYGRSTFFQGGLTNVKALFGDPALTCYSPDWIEPAPVNP